jgi:NADP-dependent 3-hydroxy acid dehydrogenase YdfG
MVIHSFCRAHQTDSTDTLRRELVRDKIRQQFESWQAQMRQLQSEDIAAAILYAVTQPSHVGVSENLVRPTDQEI